MNNTTTKRRRLQSELKAIEKYTLNGKVLAKQLGLSYKGAIDKLLEMREWLAQGEGIFLEDRLLMLCKLRPGEVRMTKVIKEAAPLINTMLYKTRKISQIQLDNRTRLLGTIPLLTMTVLYGILRASGRIREGNKSSLKIARSSVFVYEKMDKELKNILGNLKVLFQGKVNTDLQKVLFIGANASPMGTGEEIAKGFPPVAIWMLQRYMENKENDYFI